MESQGFVFLFIQEENKLNTSKRIMKFIGVLNELKLESKIPSESENPLVILNDMKYKPSLIMFARAKVTKNMHLPIRLAIVFIDSSIRLDINRHVRHKS